MNSLYEYVLTEYGSLSKQKIPTQTPIENTILSESGIVYSIETINQCVKKEPNARYFSDTHSIIEPIQAVYHMVADSDQQAIQAFQKYLKLEADGLRAQLADGLRAQLRDVQNLQASLTKNFICLSEALCM